MILADYSRPFWPLFLHVLGAMVLVGALLAVLTALALAWKDGGGGSLLRRIALRTLLLGAVPAYVAMRVGAQWLDGLGAEIEAVLNHHKARSGYATLAGSVRPVWVLRQSQIKLEKAKTVRSEAVEVLERI